MRLSSARSRRPLGSVLRAGAVVLAAVALAGAAVAGCGGAAATSGVEHYSNAAYGFSLDVDRHLTEWRSATAASGAAFEVSFVDAQGATVGDRHLDALTVSVVDTRTSPTSEEAAQLIASLRTLGAAMVAKMGADAQAGTISDVSLNGLSGVVVPYGVTIAGVPQVGWLYLLTGGGHIYALSAGATAAQWDAHRPLFERALNSFRAG